MRELKNGWFEYSVEDIFGFLQKAAQVATVATSGNMVKHLRIFTRLQHGIVLEPNGMLDPRRLQAVAKKWEELLRKLEAGEQPTMEMAGEFRKAMGY